MHPYIAGVGLKERDLAMEGYSSLIFAITPIIGLSLCVFTHIAISRMMPMLSHLKGIISSFVIGLIAVLGLSLTFAVSRISLVSLGDAVGSSLVWIVSYVCLAYCYVIGFYNVGESARRVRILIELYSAGVKGMTLEEILAVYNARVIVAARLDRLLGSGQIVERDGRYFIGSPFMLYVSKILVLLKVVFLGAESEFGSRVANTHHPR
jgi:hypothetical protein